MSRFVTWNGAGEGEGLGWEVARWEESASRASVAREIMVFSFWVSGDRVI